MSSLQFKDPAYIVTIKLINGDLHLYQYPRDGDGGGQLIVLLKEEAELLKDFLNANL